MNNKKNNIYKQALFSALCTIIMTIAYMRKVNISLALTCGLLIGFMLFFISYSYIYSNKIMGVLRILTFVIGFSLIHIIIFNRFNIFYVLIYFIVGLITNKLYKHLQNKTN